MPEVGEAWITVKARDRIGGAISSMKSKMQRAAQQMQAAGRSLTAGVTAPILGIGAAAFKASADMEQALGQAAAQADLTSQEIDKIRESAEQVAGETGQSFQKVVDAFKFARSSGVEMAEANELVASTAKAAAAGFGDQVGLLRTTTTAMKNFGDEVEGPKAALGTLVGVAQNSEVKVDQLGDAFKRATQPASNLGMSMKRTASNVAAIGEQFGNVTRAGRSFTTLLTNLKTPGAAASEAIESVYGSVDRFHSTIAEEGLAQALLKLQKGLNATGRSLGEVARGSRQENAALALLNDNASRTAEIFNSVTKPLQRVDKALKKSSNTYRNFKKVIRNTMTFLRPLGDTIRNLVNNALKSLNKWLKENRDMFDKMSKEQKQQIAKWAGIAAAIGPVLMALGGFISLVTPVISLLWSMGAGLLTLIGYFGKIPTSIFKFGGVLKTVGTAMLSFGGSLWRIISLLATSGSLWTTVAGTAKWLGSAIAGLLSPFWGWAAAIAAVVAGFFTLIGMLTTGQTEVDSWTDTLWLAWEGLKATAGAIWSILGPALKWLGQITATIIKGAIRLFGQLIGVIAEAASWFNWFGGEAEDAGEKAAESTKNLKEEAEQIGEDPETDRAEQLKKEAQAAKKKRKGIENRLDKIDRLEKKKARLDRQGLQAMDSETGPKSQRAGGSGAGSGMGQGKSGAGSKEVGDVYDATKSVEEKLGNIEGLTMRERIGLSDKAEQIAEEEKRRRQADKAMGEKLDSSLTKDVMERLKSDVRSTLAGDANKRSAVDAASTGSGTTAADASSAASSTSHRPIHLQIDLDSEVLAEKLFKEIPELKRRL